MSYRIWGANAVEQCTEGKLLPADAKPKNYQGSANIPGGGTETSLFAVTMAANEEYYLQTVNGSSNVHGCWRIEVDGAEVANIQSSGSDLKPSADYGAGYIKVPAGKKLEVFATQFTVAIKNMKVNLGGGLVTGN